MDRGGDVDHKVDWADEVSGGGSGFITTRTSQGPRELLILSISAVAVSDMPPVFSPLELFLFYLKSMPSWPLKIYALRLPAVLARERALAERERSGRAARPVD